MPVTEIIERFMQLEGAALGRGPRHLTQPNKSIEPLVEALLSTYPLLRRDQCYCDFLETYAGAAIDRPDHDMVSILGFTDVSLNIKEVERIVAEGGLFMFAMCVYHRDTEQEFYSYEYDFALEVSGTRTPGIYKWVSALRQGGPTSPSWHIADFCSWLEELIGKDGVYERPAFS